MVVLGAHIAAAQKAVPVRGYVKKDGTYVAPHMRSAPDGTTSNNWSTQGNVNPYTGEPGAKTTGPAAATVGSASSTARAETGRPPSAPVAKDSPPSAAAPAAALEPPSDVTKHYGWQISLSRPARTLTEALQSARASGLGCRSTGMWSPCRPINRASPLDKNETAVNGAVFFGAVNRVSGKLEVFGFPAIDDCQQRAGWIASLHTADYAPAFRCEVVTADAVSKATGLPMPAMPAEPETPASPDRSASPARPAAPPTDDEIAAQLVARQDKHARVCAIIQKLGPRIDGLTTYEAAAVIAEAIPDFTKEDFTQIAVKYGVVRCFEPHTKTVDNCTNGDILRFRKGRCR
jgi:hypothetical protein